MMHLIQEYWCPPLMFHVIDFTKITEEQYYEIDVPLKFTTSVCTGFHGLTCWFDVVFDERSWFTTTTGVPTTHWYQIRCVLSQPIRVMAEQTICFLLCILLHFQPATLLGLGAMLQTSSCKLDLKEPYIIVSLSHKHVMLRKCH